MFSKRRICDLNQTYLTLRYNEITNSVKTLDNASKIEETLFHMANDGLIKAKINSEQ